MGFEDKVETIFQATLPIAVGGSKRTCELTSSIVPRGTPFHHLVELELLLVHGVRSRETIEELMKG